ncbi:MAG TPA: TlpA disulfide reductase family protein [Streptosporangiaceae bacterium]|nr:TlpA disulfide reductase family protein [Streptosporangiaceae bacterium]
MTRLPRSASATGGNRAPRARSRAVQVIAVTSLAATGLLLAGCDGGAIGANTPISSGQSFVGASYQTTVYKPGSRPTAPQVSGTTLTGQHLSLASYRGDVVVLNFWGSWCTPCRDEAPGLGTLARQMYGRGVRFVGIDIRDEPDSALAFMQTFRISYPSISDPNDFIALQFHSTVPPAAIPSTIVIDRSGGIAARVVGAVGYLNLKYLIDQVLAERA